MDIVNTDDNKPKRELDKKKVLLAVGGVACVALVSACVYFFATSGVFSNINTSSEVEKQKTAIKEVYSKGDIDLSDDDFIIKEVENDEGETETVVEVKDDKKSQLTTAKNQSLDSVFADHGYTESGTVDDDGNYVPPTEEGREVTDATDPSAVPSEANILNRINTQNDLVKQFMTRSSNKDNNYYADVFTQMLEDVKSGKGDELYDNHPNFTNSDAFSVLCGYIYTIVSGSNTTDVWTNSFLDAFSGDAFSSDIKNQFYEQKYSSVDYIEKNQDYSFDVNDTTIQSSYIIYSGNVKIITDFSFNVLDIIA